MVQNINNTLKSPDNSYSPGMYQSIKNFEIEDHRSLNTPKNDAYGITIMTTGTPKNATYDELGTRLKEWNPRENKMFSHKLPLNLNYKRIKIDENLRRSVLQKHDANNKS